MQGKEGITKPIAERRKYMHRIVAVSRMPKGIKRTSHARRQMQKCLDKTAAKSLEEKAPRRRLRRYTKERKMSAFRIEESGILKGRNPGKCSHMHGRKCSIPSRVVSMGRCNRRKKSWGGKRIGKGRVRIIIPSSSISSSSSPSYSFPAPALRDPRNVLVAPV